MKQKNYINVFLQVLLWLFYTLIPLFYTLQRLANDPSWAEKSTFNNPIFWLFVNISSIGLFYFNSEYLIPNFFKKKKVVSYFVILGGIIVILILIRVALRIYITGDSDKLTYYFYFNSLLPYLFIFAISTSYRFFSDYVKEDKIKSDLENERLKSELSFLRSQISPHFMFNLLNSMVSLARKKSDLLEPMLIKMSEILRYMLYEKDDSKISIDKENAYLTNYIDLQILRFGKKVTVNFISKIENESLLIEPMLLIPFVENAFKHGTGMVKEPTIAVELETNSEGIFFRVKNIKSTAQLAESKDSSSGIGLANVKRRLDLLYKKKHILEIIDSENSYQVSLTIFS